MRKAEDFYIFLKIQSINLTRKDMGGKSWFCIFSVHFI